MLPCVMVFFLFWLYVFYRRCLGGLWLLLKLFGCYWGVSWLGFVGHFDWFSLLMFPGTQRPCAVKSV